MTRGLNGTALGCVAALIAFSMLPGFAGAGQATPVAATSTPAWTQFGVDGLVARTFSNGDCPAIEIDGQSAPMTLRAASNRDFPRAVCEAAIPADSAAASIGGQELALMPSSLARIAIVGDTGCRIWQDRIQDCNNPASWPLVEISRQIAAWQPDLIIHVGDYVYRESACPDGDTRCAGTPFGDTGATWDVDFFDPMASSLGAAPWIFLRGNHETCDREGMGWFRTLDPWPMPDACQIFTEPFRLPIPGMTMLVMDTAMIGDTKSTPELDAEYARQFDVLASLTTQGAWLLTHRPIAGGILRLSDREQYVSYATVRNAVNNELPDGIEVVLSGHIHLAEALMFGADQSLQAQIIAGHGGTAMDDGETAAFSGELLGNPHLDAGLVGASFGWMTLETEADRLTATALAVDGGILFRVHLPKPTMAK